MTTPLTRKSHLSDAKSRPRRRIQSVTGHVGSDRWTVTTRETEDELYFADSRDVEDVQTDLATLATAYDVIRDLAEEQATRLDHFEIRLASLEASTKKFGGEFVAQLNKLEGLLGGEGIPQALKQLCDQQLAAIDERMMALKSLETRVRELVKKPEA